jgi:hypothetical protein
MPQSLPSSRVPIHGTSGLIVGFAPHSPTQHNPVVNSPDEFMQSASQHRAPRSLLSIARIPSALSVASPPESFTPYTQADPMVVENTISLSNTTPPSDTTLSNSIPLLMRARLPPLDESDDEDDDHAAAANLRISTLQAHAASNRWDSGYECETPYFRSCSRDSCS